MIDTPVHSNKRTRGNIMTSSNRITFASACKTAVVVAIIGMASTFAVTQMSSARFVPTLAKDFTQQSAALSTAGDRDGALAASQKAVKEYRHLLRAAPLFYQAALAAKLADSLDILSARLATAGDSDGARTATREASALRQYIARDNPRYAANVD
jgi:hypothetical protein